MRTDNTKPLPEFVNILNSDGSIRKMSYKDLKKRKNVLLKIILVMDFDVLLELDQATERYAAALTVVR